MRRDEKKQLGFSLVELLVSMSIFTAMSAAVYSMMFISQGAMVTTQAQMDLRDGAQLVLERMQKELRASGEEVQIDANGNVTNIIDQAVVSDGAGSGGSDVVRFAVPISCSVGGVATFINPTTNNFYWGAPLTWGCSQPSCMDADGNCSTIDYRWIEYRKNSSDQLVRQVLDSSNTVVREDILAGDVSDFQIIESADVNRNMMTLTVTMAATASNGRAVTFSNSISVYLRNNRTNGGG